MLCYSVLAKVVQLELLEIAQKAFLKLVRNKIGSITRHRAVLPIENVCRTVDVYHLRSSTITKVVYHFQ